MDPFALRHVETPGSEALQRWVTIWNTISVAMALFTAGFTLANGHHSPATVALVVGFALVFLGWYWMFIIRLDRWGRRSVLLAISFSVMMLLLAGMTTIDGIYYMQLFSLYGIIFSVLEAGLAVPLAVFLSAMGAAIIIFNNRLTLSESTGVIIGFGIAAFFSVLMGLFISAIIRQSAERQQIIEALQAARADLAKAERQAGIFEERQRLAREIHDTLAQGFTSIVMHLEAADEALSVKEALPADETSPNDSNLRTVRQHLNQARATARESLAEARRFVWALRSEPMEQESLAQAIRRVAARWAEESGVSAQVEISGDERPLPSPYEVTLLRTAQEALVNIRKHAAARQVNLTLTYMPDQVILDVQDDGQGFDPSQPNSDQIARDGSGFGLIGMRERAEQLGGSLAIESAPGEGTTLVVQLPLAQAAHSTSEAA